MGKYCCSAKHEPYCSGPTKCGGMFRCLACGDHVGFCRGANCWVYDVCPACWKGPPAPFPELKYKPLVKTLSRNRLGWFVWTRG